MLRILTLVHIQAAIYQYCQIGTGTFQGGGVPPTSHRGKGSRVSGIGLCVCVCLCPPGGGGGNHLAMLRSSLSSSTSRLPSTTVRGMICRMVLTWRSASLNLPSVTLLYTPFSRSVNMSRLYICRSVRCRREAPDGPRACEAATGWGAIFGTLLPRLVCLAKCLFSARRGRTGG